MNNSEFSTINTSLHNALFNKGISVVVNKQSTIEVQNVQFSVDSNALIGKDFDQKEFYIEFKLIQRELPRIVQQLTNDKFTRQAVINNFRVSKLPACICLIQFLYRYNKLNMLVYFRSSNIDRLENDVISLAKILQYAANSLRMKLGKIYITIGSLHQYV